MITIQALREKRTAKAKEARNIMDSVGADETFSVEKSKQIDALYQEVGRIDDQIAKLEKLAALEAETNPTAEEQNGGVNARNRGANDPEARDREVFARYIRGGDRALTAEDLAHIQSRPRGEQSTGSGPAGGFLTTTDFVASLLERMAAYGGVRQSGVTNIQTSDGNDQQWPTTDETSQEGEIVGENQQVGSSSVNFGTVKIGAHMYSSKVIPISFQLIQDARIDVISFVSRALAERIARIQNRHFTVGTGVNQPRGFVTAAKVGKTTASAQTTTIIYEDLIDMEHSVDPAYRASGRCRWQFHDNTLKALKKLKDSTGRPLWVPGLTAGEPDQLLRYPYTINQHMASSIAASAKTMAFGDFSKYLVRDVMQATLFRFDDSAYAKLGQVGFLVFARGDGNVIDSLDSDGYSGAFKVLQQAAS